MLILLLVASLNAQDALCASCHPDIVRTYSHTAMARTSAKVVPRNHPPAKPFLDATTQTTFSILQTPQSLLLKFSKGPGITGTRPLEWFLGSGRVGRSYLFRMDDRLFQSPLSYYSAAARWQLSPGFERRNSLDLTREVEPSCLNCHASNFNATTLTMDPGISCTRCHGDARQHLATLGKSSMVNPKKLPPHERDSICAQCHLTGVARVAKFRTDNAVYQPGKKLSDFSALFVWDQPESSTIGVTSHFEKLAASRCKISSGDDLSCTTCHDPHSEPEPQKASAFFNEKCRSCHAQKPCPKAPQGVCISCHMPKAAGRGVDHSSYTDHSIPRKPNTTSPATSTTLVPFWPNTTVGRDLGLAYSIVGKLDQAQPLLESAAKDNPRDTAALSQLAQLHDRQGREDLTQPLYEAILKLDPNNATAANNLAVIKIKAGQAAEAIVLWRRALTTNPAQTGARMNLAQALFRQGNKAAAAIEVQQALIYEPDQPAARRLLNQLRLQP